MAPTTSPNPEKNDNKHKMQKDNVVKLLTRGKLSGKLAQHLFRELPPLVRVPLKNIVTEEDRARHTFIGFTKFGRYVLSYCISSTQGWTNYAYHLYWWEFNLHSKLKLVQRVQLVDHKEIITEEDLYFTVCEWPNDDSKIVIFAFDASHTKVLFVTISSKPPSAPCSNCYPIPVSATSPTISTDTVRGECLRHGYRLTNSDKVDGTLIFHAALQMKKDQVFLWDTQDSLIVCGISFCPEGGHRQSPKIFASVTPPLSESGSELSVGDCDRFSTSSSPSSLSSSSSLPHRYPEGRQRSNWASFPSWSSSSSSPSSCTLTPPGPPPISPCMWALSLGEPTDDVDYRHLHYCFSSAAFQTDDDRLYWDEEEMLFYPTDLTGRDTHFFSGSHKSPCVCVEQLTLHYETLINNLIRSGTWGDQICNICDYNDYDPVILDVCPETNQVIIDIGLLLLHSVEPKEYRSNLQVSLDLNTGMCWTIGVGDLTEFNRELTGDWKCLHRNTCAKCPVVPDNSYIHCMDNTAQEEGMLVDRDRCTSIVF